MEPSKNIQPEGRSRVYVPIEHLLARATHRAAKKVSVSEPREVVKVDLPASSSLREKVTEIYDQGQIGSCTANAFAAAYRIQNGNTFKPSRLWVYYYERLVESPKPSNLTDSGADVIDGLAYVQKHGVCSEGLWPYDVTKYNVCPPHRFNHTATLHRLQTYSQINFSDIKARIASGKPVLIAIKVYESFESSVNGNIPLPKDGEALLGGHEMCLVGYNDSTQTFEVQNSWGSDWGDKGFCHIPYAYLQNPEWCIELSEFDL